ncbi:MAG: MATE family efflux transporter [Bradymonadaceae bacterium]
MTTDLSDLGQPVDREILDLAVPALGGLAASPLVSLVDTAFVGQLGSTQLGALGVNASLFSMAFVVFNFLAYGTAPKVGRAVGEDAPRRAGRVVLNAGLIALVAGSAATGALLLLDGPILELMGATCELRGPAATYLHIRAFAGPAVLLINAGRGAFRGYQDTRTPMFVTVGLSGLNLLLDPILIFGLGWGLAGAATATLVAQWCGAGAFVFLLLVHRREELGIVVERPRLEELTSFLRVGWEMVLRTGALVGTMTVATAVAARVGTTAVAAHQVAQQLWTFLALLVDALAVAAQALVSRYLGEGRPDEARRVSDRLLQWGLAVGLALGAGFALLQPWLPALFTDDPTTRQAVSEIFVFVAGLQLLNGLVFVWDGIYMGAEAFNYLAKAMLLSALGACALLLAVRPLGLGLRGVWWGITALMALRFATLLVPYLRGRLFDDTDDSG